MIFSFFLSLICVCSLTCLYFSVKKNLEFIDVYESTMLQIEESLEVLSFYQKRIERKSKLEVFSDDFIVKELVEDIKQSKKAVLLVSEKLTGEKENFEGEDVA